jgi:hypothetical protein
VRVELPVRLQIDVGLHGASRDYETNLRANPNDARLEGADAQPSSSLISLTSRSSEIAERIRIAPGSSGNTKDDE